MNKKSIEELGFRSVLQHIQSCALSYEGVQNLETLDFLSDRTQLQARQDMVRSFVTLLCRPDLEPPLSFGDIQEAMVILENPRLSLEGQHIITIANYIESAKALLNFTREQLEDHQMLSPIMDLMGEAIDPVLIKLAQDIGAVLDASGQVKETHPAIRSLRKQVEQAKGERSKFCGDFIKTNNDVVQSDQSAYRDGRLVIPVRNDRRTEVQGFISSASSSGSTVFMEPYRLVEMNNAVVMAENQILIEIAKILAQLNDQVVRCRKELSLLRLLVGKTDGMYACARYALQTHAHSSLLFNDHCNLIDARHPLLGQKAVPITVCLKDKVKAVVISGPNAGGKTVTIKTVGLLALLNQFCGYIPAKEGSSLPLFDEVFTDIGDDQSIEEALSTFSGHMKQVGHILRSMTENSLVIMDELGSGTDPVEGSAIARATLEYCLKKAKLSLVTSHHGVLKQFAYAKESVINASMEFDEETHLPTFRVINGIPGDSHALDTARLMNLPSEVLEKAQQYLGSEAVQIGEIIKDLEKRRREADAAEIQIKNRYHELQMQVKQVQLKELKLKQETLLLKEEQSTELSRFMREKRKELENLVSELRSGEITREKTKKVKTFVSSITEKQHMTEAELEEELQDFEVQPRDESIEFVPDMDVLCGLSKREGRIIRKASKGKWIVAIGNMKFTLPESDLSLPKQRQKSVKVLYQSSAPPPKIVLDVRGMTLEEALASLDSQIESALVHGMSTFSIIHGYGDGILSKGIGEYLKSHQRVADYRFALPEDGGMGKTYVFF